MVVWILTLLKGPTQPPATVGDLEMALLVGDLVGNDEVAALCAHMEQYQLPLPKFTTFAA